MIGQMRDLTLNAARQRQRVAELIEQAVLNRVDARDDACGLDPAHDKLFACGRCGILMSARLRDNNLSRKLARNRFGNRKHMMFAGGCQRLLFTAGTDVLPGKDPRLMQVVQDFAADGSVVVERQALENILIEE